MESAAVQDYFPLPEARSVEGSNWGQEWANNSSCGMPIWQFTAAALSQQESPKPYYIHGSSVSPFFKGPSGMPSPTSPGFSPDPRYSSTPGYDALADIANNPLQRSRINVSETTDNNEIMEDEDLDGFPWGPEPAIATRASIKPRHRRRFSKTEALARNAKRAHTIVEKNYRERLNDKIADLALYLFETSSDSRTKPSKSLVMTRAKERLKQLGAQNKLLEGEVIKLRQHIAILDHIVASKGEIVPPNRK